MIQGSFTEPHWLEPLGVEFLGTAPYFAYPRPQPPAQRSAEVPPVTAPKKPIWGWFKAGLPRQATPAWWAQQGGLTYGPGAGPGQGLIQSAGTGL